MIKDRANDGHSVAVIGIACRFPGEAYNGERFWEMICKGRCAPLPHLNLQLESIYVDAY